jgi:hypothetical protein
MFDWYLSPADKFRYETEFKKHGKSLITFQDILPFAQSLSISENNIHLVWKLIDIQHQDQINGIQAVYFYHIIKSIYRGSVVPIGLPLDIKEQFLMDQVDDVDILYHRPKDQLDLLHASVDDLEREIKVLESKIVDLKQKNQDLESSCNQDHEVEEMVAYYSYKKQCIDFHVGYSKWKSDVKRVFEIQNNIE